MKSLTFLLLSLSTLGFGVDMKLNGVGNNGVLAGVYVGPYVADIGGVPTPVICDDFAAETYVGQQWTATEYNVGSIAGVIGQTRWGSGGVDADEAIAKYQQAAWLALQLVGPSPTCVGTCAGNIQFAIWQLFSPTAVAQHLATDPMPPLDEANVAGWLDRAANEYQGGDYSNVYVYTPTTRWSPQEFLVVKTPEPGAILVLALQLAGVAGICWMVRRKTANNN